MVQIQNSTYNTTYQKPLIQVSTESRSIQMSQAREKSKRKAINGKNYFPTKTLNFLNCFRKF